MACYMIGAIPFGVIVAHLRGVNILQAGSGNIGATNVGRVVGKPFGILVLLLDFAKGAGPMWFVARWRGSVDAIAVMAGLAAVLGHVFPVYLGFRGGKGVAVGAGVAAVLLPIPVIVALIAFVATLLASRMVSLSSIVSAIALAGTQLSLSPRLNDPATILAIVAALLVFVRHLSNLSRIQAGTESRFDESPKLAAIVPGLHALAVGLWCGAGWFFTFGVAGRVFTAFGRLVEERPDWLVISGNPQEFGSRLAGLAVAPMFPGYFGLQAVCGLVAFGIAVAWCFDFRARRQRVRAWLLAIALLLVAAGWPVAERVSDLRLQRYSGEPAQRESVRTEFGRWHLISVFINLGVLACTAPALALAAYPPRKEMLSP
ncbi:MAG: glycerol-3-phosphate 1-O-acyltransferase PlsY [Gemmataceae bacterium]